MANVVSLQSDHPLPATIADIERMALSMSKSGLFPGMRTPDQAIALMLLAHAEGMHPAIAARDFDVIQGRQAKKAEAMMRDFMRSGGKVDWHELTDTAAEATFSHPQGGSLKLRWDMDRAKKADLGGKDMWRKYPRQMLRARLISEGVRTVFPLATSGMYVPEEVRDIDERPMADVTPPAEPAPRPTRAETASVTLYPFSYGDGSGQDLTGTDWLIQAEIALSSGLSPVEWWAANEATFYQIQEAATEKGVKKAIAACGKLLDLVHKVVAVTETKE